MQMQTEAVSPFGFVSPCQLLASLRLCIGVCDHQHQHYQPDGVQVVGPSDSAWSSVLTDLASPLR